MNPTQQKSAYETARAVGDGRLSAGDGARKLHAELGLNLGSAQALIYVYLCMRKGTPFKRALSASDLSYFLSQVHLEDGGKWFRSALESVRGHITYREGMGVAQKANRNVLQEYEKKLQPVTNSSSNDEFVTVPFYVEADGSKTLFLPGLRQPDGYRIGAGPQERQVKDYWSALAAVCAMPTPSFWRKTIAGDDGIVVCVPGDCDDVKRAYLESQISSANLT